MFLNIHFHSPIMSFLVHSILLRPSRHSTVTVNTESVLVTEGGHAEGTIVLASNPQVLVDAHTAIAVAVAIAVT